MRITGAFALSLSLGAAVAVAGCSRLTRRASRQEGRRRWRGPRGERRGGQQAEGRAPRRSQGGNLQVGDEARRGHGAGRGPRSRRSTKQRIDKARAGSRASSSASATRWQRELTAVKKSFTKFEGQKTGWDVSIIGPEFQQNTAEAVLVTKEDIWTRYFFFFEDGLYKMFLAFNKDAIGGKSFQDFGKGMEAKYGHAKEVYRDDKTKRRRQPHAGSLRVVGGRRRPAEAGRPLGVLRRLLPGAVRRIGRRTASTSGARSSTPARSKQDELVEARHRQEREREGLRHRRRHHRSRRRQGGQEAGRRAGQEPGHRRRRVQPAARRRLVVGLGRRREEEGDEQQELVVVLVARRRKRRTRKKKGGKKSDNPMDGLEL